MCIRKVGTIRTDRLTNNEEKKKGKNKKKKAKILVHHMKKHNVTGERHSSIGLCPAQPPSELNKKGKSRYYDVAGKSTKFQQQDMIPTKER